MRQKFTNAWVDLKRLGQSRVVPGGPVMEFHISKLARDRYEIDMALFMSTGNVVFSDLDAVRQLALRINSVRQEAGNTEQTISAGQLYVMGLVDEILHYVVELYREQMEPAAISGCLASLEKSLGAERVDGLLAGFCERFPPMAVYRDKQPVADYLAGESGGRSHREMALEELLLLYRANANPANEPYIELFDDTDLALQCAYNEAISGIEQFFEGLPTFGPHDEPLPAMLMAPVKHAPTSLIGQLQYMREHWGMLISGFLDRMLLGHDLVTEEEMPRFGGPGPAEVLSFGSLEDVGERFTEDRDWMPRVVLMAKSTYVWLNQLSHTYQRHIHRLDQIPDDELDKLAGWGFNGLWLIGLWQRGNASKEIKRRCGNPEAMASAYAIDDYVISHELGGEEAFQDLKSRAWKRGIRMAGDMVPNHMAMDSRWVMEHPDWFVQSAESPFPQYKFESADLTPGSRAAVMLEDGYYNRTDAAVVFKWCDRASGQTRYIYHGNDGTSMPWNDTAQLNFLMPEVREAVVQTILHVARKFPVIRFDAAMILTKQHYSRLWFPPPGHGGAIPSRAGRGVTVEQFNELFSKEFWREVVDRIAEEAPDTLLLAEAFWLLEGYFVRTLGMHRVYNSAFMNMLKDEENEKYRSVVKNVLAYNPRILERFVNFMNNPDEDPAAVQFGTSDKYLGVCALMVTMPGLPMFGHGQIEGFQEKYGMEYGKAYWDEQPDQGLIDRHTREVFPLMKKRYMFSGVENFRFYDAWLPDGGVDENVYVYSNRARDERSLVVYNNRYQNTSIWINHSVPHAEGPEGERQLVTCSLFEGLDLKVGETLWYKIHEFHSGLTYLRHSREIAEQGLFTMLNGYQFQVYTGFAELLDEDGQIGRLASMIGGAGIRDLDEELLLLELKGLRDAFPKVADPLQIERFAEWLAEEPSAEPPQWWLESSRVWGEQVVVQIDNAKLDWAAVEPLCYQEFLQLHRVLSQLSNKPRPDTESSDDEQRRLFERNWTAPEELNANAVVLRRWWYWRLLRPVADLDRQAGLPEPGRRLENWVLGRIFDEIHHLLGVPIGPAERDEAMVILFARYSSREQIATELLAGDDQSDQRWALLLGDPWMCRLLELSHYDGLEWINREAFLDAAEWLALHAAVTTSAGSSAAVQVELAEETVARLAGLAEKSGYRYRALLAELAGAPLAQDPAPVETLESSE